MAEIKTIISDDMTIRKVIGAPDVDELIVAVKEYYAGRPTKYILWDLSMASAKNLASNDIKYLVELVKTYADIRTGGKTAVIAPFDLEYGMTRMSQAYANFIGLQFSVSVFRSVSDARKWLGVDVPTVDD